MLRRIVSSWLLVLVVGMAASAEDKSGFVPLFNGKDLTGFKTHPDDKARWEVKDGLIVGTGGVGHLYSERGDYENFHYRVEAKINDMGNSGQYFRTQFGKGFPKGYEAQINSTHRDPIKTGSLYGFPERLVKDQLVKPDEFFTYEVIARGNHITIKVNGKETVNFEDAKGTYKKGHFAFQQHHDGSVVKIKSVEVKVDDGPWQAATLDPSTTSKYSWKLFTYNWKGATAGEHTIVSRVTDTTGRVQPTSEELETKKTFLEDNSQHPRKVMIA